jgi:two-component sensor histidine kinase
MPPPYEKERMDAVKRYEILDTPEDGSFDRITAIAARRFSVPISIISIVDHDRIWFKSHHGLAVEQIDRAPGLCASAILSSEPYILANAATDPRSMANPLVAGASGFHFYVGVPLRTSDGHNLGTLCVIDKAPRTVDPEQIEDLKDLASIVMDQMELRLSARKAVAHAQLMAREIDHRVMNSLQFVSGLLSMQSRGSAEGDAKTQLQMAASRVAAVARVHSHFLSNEAAQVSCLTFLRRLCADLSGILGKPIDVHGDDGDVPSTSIQPIGLIVNELVTNAAKNGAETMFVSYRINGDMQELTVCDDGEGLPPEFDIAASAKGLGMRVVTNLASQLGGRVSALPRRGVSGACFTITFPD